MKKIIACIFILFTLVSSAAALDDLMALQGNVLNSSGSPINGNLTVLIYDAASGGTPVYNSSNDFFGKISNGQYDIMLGNGSVNLSLEYGKIYYMDLIINGEDATFDGADRQVFQSSTGMIKVNDESNDATGIYAVGMGYSNSVDGNYSIALGDNNNASGINSIALGSNSVASGIASTAIHGFAQADAAFGVYGWATGQASVSIGQFSTSSGKGSVALGYDNDATGNYSLATGYKSNASGIASTSIGRQNNATGDYSFAVGRINVASGLGSFASGQATSATGDDSTAMGSATLASGYGSTAMGDETTASGDASTATGYNTTASGDYSTAMGYLSSASGRGSSALGISIASGNYSFAGGGARATALGAAALGTSSASGIESVALGEEANATGRSSIALAALAFGNSSFAAMAGISRGYTSFALGSYIFYHYNGSTGQEQSESIGDGSFAIQGGKAEGQNSFARGSNIIVSGENSFVIGLYEENQTDPQADINITKSNIMAVLGGNVGIGTTSPNATLHVNGTISTNITSCSALETDSNGNIICGTDQTGSGIDTVWTLVGDYLYNNSGSLDINETKLNDTIDKRIGSGDGQGINQTATSYLYDDGQTISFNETKLNQTITTLDTNTNCSVDSSCTAITYDTETTQWDKNATDDFDGNWSSLSSIPAGFADNIDDTGTGLWTNSSGNATITTGNVGIGTATPDSLLDIVGTGASKKNLEAIHTFSNGTGLGAGAVYRPYQYEVNYIAEDLAWNNAMTGLGSTVNYGTGGVPAIGTTHANTLETVVRGSGDANNEYAIQFGVLRYDIGTGYTQSTGPTGRGWFTDYNIHGPVGVQPDMLNGITLFYNNYYNGSPADSPAASIWLVTKKGAGGSADATHSTADTFPIDVGLGIVGTSNSGSATKGFEKAIQIGGYGSGWMESGSSNIGTGIDISDFEDYGIYIHNRSGSGPAIAIASGQGNVGIGTSNPNATLHVSGLIMSTPTDSPGSCNSTTRGAFYMDNSENVPCFCNSSAWVKFENSSATC